MKFCKRAVQGPRRAPPAPEEAPTLQALWGRPPVCLGVWPLLAPRGPRSSPRQPCQAGLEALPGGVDPAGSGRSAVTAGLSHCRAQLRRGMTLGGVPGLWQPPWVLEGGAPPTVRRLQPQAAT